MKNTPYRTNPNVLLIKTYYLLYVSSIRKFALVGWANLHQYKLSVGNVGAVTFQNAAFHNAYNTLQSKPSKARDNITIMLPTYTRRRLLKAATLAGMGVVLVPVSALLPAASAQSQPPASPSRHTPDSIMVNGWLLRASDR